jgi:hypothetical protein
MKPGDSPLDDCPLNIAGEDQFLGFSYVRSYGEIGAHLAAATHN